MAQQQQTPQSEPDRQGEPDPRDPGAEETSAETGAETAPEPADETAPEGGPEAAEADPREEIARLRDALLRLQAESDNRQKRAERELAKSRRFALEGLMRDLLPVLDSLDQGLQSEGSGEPDRLREGLELTRKQALTILGSYGLEVIDPEGEHFDPEHHEAMAAQPSESHEPDTVIQVLQKGYRLHERLLRPARVMVAREPS